MADKGRGLPLLACLWMCELNKEKSMGVEFDDFWQKYPKKVAKKDAMKAWIKLNPESQQKAFEALPLHCKRWDDPQYIPHAATWLNGERFEDELPEAAEKVVKWWESDQGTLAHGNKLGLRPRPGESMSEYRSRLKAA